MNHHKIKCTPDFFEEIKTGVKKFEIRKNDRSYQAGDKITLQEWSQADKYTGREIETLITYVLYSHDFKAGLKQGYCILSLLGSGEEYFNTEHHNKVKLCSSLDSSLQHFKSMDGIIASESFTSANLTVKDFIGTIKLENGLIVNVKLVLTADHEKEPI